MKYEGPTSYQSKDMANVKVFADKQMDGRTKGQAKTYIPLIYRCKVQKTRIFVSEGLANNAGSQHFLLFSYLFLNSSSKGSMNLVIVQYRVNQQLPFLVHYFQSVCFMTKVSGCMMIKIPFVLKAYLMDRKL